MKTSSSNLEDKAKGWKFVNRLHPTDIDLGRISLIREKDQEFLSDPANLELLMLSLGLNNESMKEMPASLLPYCGQGLRIWQYPTQFSKYLVTLSRLHICSYLEIGIRHGGTFVLTVEYLEKFHPVDFAIGLDIIPCPSMADYQAIRPNTKFVNLNTQSYHFRAFLDQYEQFDLVFIDGDHQESQCRNEFNSVKDKARIIVFHDIANVHWPDVGKVWREVRSSQEYDCQEYIDQYEGMGPYMGIGMAIRKNW